MNTIDLNKYSKFVDTLTSSQSKDFEFYINSLKELHAVGCDIARLDTAVQGLSAEAGEAMEIVKKMKYQNKPWNEDNRFHLIREAGDIIFYWINLCISLGINPNEVIAENVKKLEARYPGGVFDPHYSENRKEGDL
jgi:NTP pyrophosphatase (non-canonical NTP hydrolase)